MSKDKRGKKKPKKTKKTKKAVGTKISIVPEDDISSEEKDSKHEEDEDEGGMFLDKESIQVIFNALREYKPTEDEEHLHSVLLEEFEEILVVDYKEPYPDVN
jgi:hypothetical protein